MGDEQNDRLDQITELYRDLLQREPDDSGLMSYFHSDLDIEQIAGIIKGSPEYLGVRSKEVFSNSAETVGSTELFVMGSSPKTDENSLALKGSGIKAVLDLNCGAVKYDYTWCSEFLQVPIEKDKPVTKRQIDLCFDFIYRNIVESGNKVFVHSGSGVSRAPTIMSLFLVAEKGLSFYSALRLIHSKKQIINPHRALVPSDILEHVYKYRKKYGTVAAKPGPREVSVPQPDAQPTKPLPPLQRGPQKERSIIRVTNNLFAGPYMDEEISKELSSIGIKTIFDLNHSPRPPEMQDSRFSNVHLPLFLDQEDVLMPMITKSIDKYLEGGGLYIFCVDRPSLGAVLDSYVKSKPEILKELQQQKMKQQMEQVRSGNENLTRV